MNNKKIVELARFIHRFETDYPYRNYLSEEFKDDNIRNIAYKISCDSIDWIYFKEEDHQKFSEFFENNMGQKEGYIYVNMKDLDLSNINLDLAKLILKTAKDSNFLNDYVQLFELLKNQELIK